MYKAVKYAWDTLFVFILAVTVIVFLLEMIAEIDPAALHAVENISLGILGGYYVFFGYDLYHAKHRIKYCRQHWILIVLLLLPFLPIARLARYAAAEKIFWLVGDTAWHILDEIEML